LINNYSFFAKRQGWRKPCIVLHNNNFGLRGLSKLLLTPGNACVASELKGNETIID